MKALISCPGNRCCTAGLFFLFAVRFCFALDHIDLAGKILTVGNEPASDLVVILVGAQMKDTTDAEGEFSFYNEGPVTAARRFAHAGLRPMQGRGTQSFLQVSRDGGGPNAFDRMGAVGIFDSKGRALGTEGGNPKDRQGAPVVPWGIYFAASVRERPGHAGGLHKTHASPDSIEIRCRDSLVHTFQITSYVDTVTIQLPNELPPVRHRLLVASYSNNAAYILSEDNLVEWEYGMPGSCQDAWMLPGGNVLLSGGKKVCEVTIDKVVQWEYNGSAGEIHNCQPLSDGGFLFGENGSCRLVELDSNGDFRKEIPLNLGGDEHTQMRMVRKTKDGTYIVCARGENNVYAFDGSGNQVRKVNLTDKGVNWDAVHSAIPLKSGNLLIGGGYQTPFIEVDRQDNIVWQLSGDDIPEIGFSFAAACHVLTNGNMVIAAYNSTYKLFEMTPDKKVVWKLQNAAIGDPTHVYVLDDPGDPTKGEVIR
jgi:hypothetical protein